MSKHKYKVRERVYYHCPTSSEFGDRKVLVTITELEPHWTDPCAYRIQEGSAIFTEDWMSSSKSFIDLVKEMTL